MAERNVKVKFNRTYCGFQRGCVTILPESKVRELNNLEQFVANHDVAKRVVCEILEENRPSDSRAKVDPLMVDSCEKPSPSRRKGMTTESGLVQ
jgi:hypothetical protein